MCAVTIILLTFNAGTSRLYNPPPNILLEERELKLVLLLSRKSFNDCVVVWLSSFGKYAIVLQIKQPRYGNRLSDYCSLVMSGHVIGR